MAREGSPRRSPAAGGYARGEETRARIVAAGLKVFGDEGYVRASTRQIAKAAGVMPPALQYYFDSKEGLHRACAQFIIDSAAPRIDAALQAAEGVLAGDDPQPAVEAICDILDALLDVSLFAKSSPDWGKFSSRIQNEKDSPAGSLIQSRIVTPIRELCARLVARATGSALDDHARLRGVAILSQLSAFHLHRDSALQLLGWPDFDGPRRDAVKAVLRAHTRAVLNAPC